MIRAFAAAIGISTVSVMAAVLDNVLTPAGFSVRQVFVLSVWLGLTLAIGAAEIWIRRSRKYLEIRIA